MKTGVILLNLGGPADQDSIRPFLVSLFSDREIIRLPGGSLFQPLFARLITRIRLKEVRENYRKIGGGSPILRWTRAQAGGLESRLGDRGIDGSVAIAFRYTPPSSDEALRTLADAGVDRLLAFTLYPQYSVATTGSSLNELRRAMKRTGVDLPLTVVDRWGEHDGYLDAMAARVRSGLETWPEGEREKVVLLFSAHSLPQRFIDDGDPYVDEIEKTVAGIRRRVGEDRPWRLAWQSRTGPVKWVGPGTGEVIRELAPEGVGDVLAVPVSFVSDHIETLYEIDMLYGDEARELGIENFRRTEGLNDFPPFLDALASIAEEALR